jgi:DNA-binding NtrC family response regulator
MEGNETLPRGSAGVSVTTLRVEVVAGPDAGTSRLAEADVMTIGSAEGNDLVLHDPTVSRFHVQLEPGPAGIGVRDLDSTNQTVVGGVRIRRGTVPVGCVLELGASKVRVTNGDEVMVAIHPGDKLQGLRGSTPVMQRLMARIERASQTDKPVLIVGESGTGKELCARALHDLGPRPEGPFETVDCGSLSPNLVASELFGHERGAFTGADRKHEGAFERANGGTIFLDEIGELPPNLQVALLGVLERRKFRRVGGRVDIPCAVRVVAATNRDMRAEVNAGTFRLDLFYRLAVVVLTLPPLRERMADVPLLVEHFLRECGHLGLPESLFSQETLELIAAHRWPGNVRELRNMVESAVAMGEAPELDSRPAARPAATGAGEELANSSSPADVIAPLLGLEYKEARDRLLREFESRYLRRLVDRTKGNISRAAREAAMDRSHLTDLLARHRIR